MAHWVHSKWEIADPLSSFDLKGHGGCCRCMWWLLSLDLAAVHEPAESVFARRKFEEDRVAMGLLFVSSGVADLRRVRCGSRVTCRRTTTQCSMDVVSRREFTSWLLLGASGGDVRSGISKAASLLPGMGQSDIFFPEMFEGLWEVDSTIVDVKQTTTKEIADLDERKMYEELIGAQRHSQARFFSHRGHIVADRGFNMRSLRTAEAAALGKKQTRVSTTWDPDNPNVLTVTERGADKIREIKVTKRSFEEGRGGAGTFETSEYARIVDAREGLISPDSTSSMFSQPKILARRTLQKFRSSGADEIEGLQLDYYFPAESVSATDPEFIVKSRLKMKRQKQNFE